MSPQKKTEVPFPPRRISINRALLHIILLNGTWSPIVSGAVEW